MTIKDFFNQSLLNRKASDSVLNKIGPGVATTLGNTAGRVTVRPVNSGNVTVEVPVGQPIADHSIVPGLPMEEDVTIVVDTTALGNGLNKVPIYLFDQKGYVQTKLQYPNNPAGTVYIGSPTQNDYDSYVEELCAKSDHLVAVKITSMPAAGSAATREMQEQENIRIFRRNTKKYREDLIEVSNYLENCNSNNNCISGVVIPFTGMESRIDGNTAWCREHYEGMITRYTFYKSLRARD